MMIKPQPSTLATLLLLWPLTACQFGPESAQKLLSNTAHQVIFMNQQQFSQRTQQLAHLSTGFCQQPGASGLQALRQQWRQSMLSWQAVKLINFGPITTDNQAWKIQFWPDSKNLIRRKALQLLQGIDELTVERLAKASVVVQGLSALEYLLFDSDDGQLANYLNDPLAARRCQLLLAVSQHTQRVAANLYHAWSEAGGNYLGHFTNTGKHNQLYPDNETAIAALLDALVAGVEVAKNNQLAQPLGLKSKGDRARPYLAEAWRSRSSSQALSANLLAAQSLFLGGEGYGMDDYLIARKQAQLAEKLAQQFAQVTRQAAQATDIFEAVNDASGREQLLQLYADLGKLLAVLKRDLPPAMGVRLGFNANDGD